MFHSTATTPNFFGTVWYKQQAPVAVFLLALFEFFSCMTQLPDMFSFAQIAEKHVKRKRRHGPANHEMNLTKQAIHSAAGENQLNLSTL